MTVNAKCSGPAPAMTTGMGSNLKHHVAAFGLQVGALRVLLVDGYAEHPVVEIERLVHVLDLQKDLFDADETHA